MPWGTIAAIIQLVLSAATPALKASALAYLKTLEVAEASQPLFLMIIKEVEVMVAAA